MEWLFGLLKITLKNETTNYHKENHEKIRKLLNYIQHHLKTIRNKQKQKFYLIHEEKINTEDEDEDQSFISRKKYKRSAKL